MKDEGLAVDPHFDVAKERVLQELVACIDRSKKGGVDAPIANLLATLNGLPDYVTTSSCSGRVAIYCEADAAARKKSGCWLLASHEPVTEGEAMDVLTSPALAASRGPVLFKFEPFILHVQCRTLAAARLLLTAALDAGMRNSGLVLGKKIMVGVRMTLKLEAPIAVDGAALVDAPYIRTVVAMANGMFQENMERITRFEQQFHDALAVDQQRRADAVAKLSAKQAAKEASRSDGSCVQAGAGVDRMWAVQAKLARRRPAAAAQDAPDPSEGRCQETVVAVDSESQEDVGDILNLF